MLSFLILTCVQLFRKILDRLCSKLTDMLPLKPREEKVAARIGECNKIVDVIWK